jgi:hypothetical protein
LSKPTPDAGVGLQKAAQDGLKPKVETKAEVKVDPMLVAFQQLTATLGSLDNQMKHMNYAIQDLQVKSEKLDKKPSGIPEEGKPPTTNGPPPATNGP